MSDGLRFELLGVPVTVRLSVVLVLAFLGFQLQDPTEIALWVAIGLVSILLHELGHAAAARAAGTDPRIELAGMGGVTTYQASARARSRGWSLLIGLAGPAVGIVLGLVAIALGAPWRNGVATGAPLPEFAASVFVYVSLVWSVLNLLPILPLDGGQALAALLPGDEAQRRSRAALLGAVVGAAAAVLAFVAGFRFGAVFVAFLAFQNVQMWLDARDARRSAGGDGGVGLDHGSVEGEPR